MNEFFVHAYVVIALLAAVLLMFVIWQAINNLHLKRNDPPPVAQARKITFYASAGFLILTVIFKDYWLTNVSVLTTSLVTSGLLIMCISVLSVSMISMWLQKPTNGHKLHAWVSHSPILAKIARLTHVRLGVHDD